MKIWISACALAMLVTSAAAAHPPRRNDAGGPPYWAYPVDPPNDIPLKNDGAAHTRSRQQQVANRAANPRFVQHSGLASRRASADANRRRARPEAGSRGAAMAICPTRRAVRKTPAWPGFPVEYIEQQVMDFKTGSAEVFRTRKWRLRNTWWRLRKMPPNEEVKSASDIFPR